MARKPTAADIDANIVRAKLEREVQRLVLAKAKMAKNLIDGAVNIAAMQGASLPIIKECLLNCAADVDDRAHHDALMGSLRQWDQ